MEDIKLIKYLNKTLTPKEQLNVKQWINDSDENKLHFQKIEKLWNNATAINDFEKIDVDSQWVLTLNQMKDIDHKSQKQPKKRPSLIWKVAASVVLLACMAALYNSFFTPIILVAENGKENRHELPDGSIIWLNKDSKLTYEKDFMEELRKVTLSGEAYFEVAKNPDKPFIVKAANTSTKVLGTKFNIKENKNKIALTLNEGSVQFSSELEKEILTPGEKIIADNTGKLKKMKNDNMNFLSWKTRTLTFNHTSLKTAIEDIEIFYGIEIKTENKELLKCNLTSEFKDVPLEDVLQTLQILFQFEYQQTGENKYTFIGGSC